MKQQDKNCHFISYSQLLSDMTQSIEQKIDNLTAKPQYVIETCRLTAPGTWQLFNPTLMQ